MQAVNVRIGKSLPRLMARALPFTRPRAATPSEIFTACNIAGVNNADRKILDYAKTLMNTKIASVPRKIGRAVGYRDDAVIRTAADDSAGLYHPAGQVIEIRCARYQGIYPDHSR